MQCYSDVAVRYLEQTPLALALERIAEAKLYETRPFSRPILDIGCGEGLFAERVFVEKIDVGIDMNASELERAEELGAYSRLICCSATEIPEPDNTFLTIFSNSVFEHIPDVDSALREAYRVLAPGGMIYLTVPSQNFEKYGVIASLLTWLKLDKLCARFTKKYNVFWRHYTACSMEEWRLRLEAQGFTVAESFTYNSHAACFLNDLLVPCALPAFFVKKMTNRWFVFPRVRALFARCIEKVFAAPLARSTRCEQGGLVFLAATKRVS